jgi:outer membrane immunogenic protein
MKKLLLGSAALVALGLGAPAALAADRAVPAYAPPPPPAPVYTWSGCYAGANAGTSTGRSTQTTVANSILTPGALGVPGPAPLGVPGAGVIAPVPVGTSIAGDLNLSGFIGGFQGGCNYQFGMWVVGAEVDGMATNKEGQNFEVGLVPFLGNGRANWVSQTQERWLVTARGKLGLAGWGWFGDKSMVYVTGGAAWAKIDTSEFLVGTQVGTGHQESNTRTGWTVGGGYEYALGYGWSIKGEYLYVKFDDYTTFTQPPFGGVGLNIAPRTNKLSDNIFRAGMNYKFW